MKNDLGRTLREQMSQR